MTEAHTTTRPELTGPMPEGGKEEAILTAREDVLERMLLFGAIAAVVCLAARLVNIHIPGILVYGVAAAALYLLKIRPRWSITYRSLGFLGIIYALAIFSSLILHSSASSALYLAVLPALTVMLLGGPASIAAIAISLLTWLALGSLLQLPILPVPSAETPALTAWLYLGADVLLVMIILLQFQQHYRETLNFAASLAQQKSGLLEARAELTSRTQQLDYERYLLHTLLEAVSDKIFFKDLSGRYTRVSRAVAEQFGVSQAQVLGKTDFDFFDSQYAGQIQAEELAILQSGQAVFDRVEREVWRDGRPDTWAIKSRIPLKGEDGKITGWFGTARDITEIKKAQEADQRHIRQLAIVSDVGRAVTSSLDLHDLLRALVDLVQNTFGYHGLLVWMLTEPPETVQLKAGFSAQGEDLGQAEIQLRMQHENPITTVCRTSQHFLNNEILDPASLPLGSYFPATRSQLVLPLRVSQKVLGALEILSDQPQTFSEEDVLLLRSLADQVTIAIRNATLYEGERSRRHLAETFQRIGRAISGTLELNEVLALILAQLDELVPSDRSAVMLSAENELEFVALRGFPEAVRTVDQRVPLRDDSIYGQVFRSQRVLAIPDVLGYPDWQQLQELAHARSWMGVPLVQSEQVIGMLSLVRETLNPFTVSEATLAQTLADQAAVALENARLYDNLTRFTRQLREMVQQRTQELQRAYDQLERLDRTKSDFIRVTSHELRTPLTVLQGYSQMLLQAKMVADSSSLSELSQGIHSGATRMHEIVNTMLDIAKIDNRALELSAEPLQIAFLVKNVAANFERAYKQRDVRLLIQPELQDLPPIEGDFTALSKVFSQLISNALKYTPDGGQVTISGSALPPGNEMPDGGVEIVFQDTGIGIDPAQLELIFTKFYQTGEVALHSSGRTKFKGGGPGLGLPIARGIIQAHNGKLWAESPGYDETSHPGSQFHIILPVRQKVASS